MTEPTDVVHYLSEIKRTIRTHGSLHTTETELRDLCDDHDSLKDQCDRLVKVLLEQEEYLVQRLSMLEGETMASEESYTHKMLETLRAARQDVGA